MSGSKLGAQVTKIPRQHARRPTGANSFCYTFACHLQLDQGCKASCTFLLSMNPACCGINLAVWRGILLWLQALWLSCTTSVFVVFIALLQILALSSAIVLLAFGAFMCMNRMIPPLLVCEAFMLWYQCGSVRCQCLEYPIECNHVWLPGRCQVFLKLSTVCFLVSVQCCTFLVYLLKAAIWSSWCSFGFHSFWEHVSSFSEESICAWRILLTCTVSLFCSCNSRSMWSCFSSGCELRRLGWNDHP